MKIVYQPKPSATYHAMASSRFLYIIKPEIRQFLEERKEGSPGMTTKAAHLSLRRIARIVSRPQGVTTNWMIQYGTDPHEADLH